MRDEGSAAHPWTGRRGPGGRADAARNLADIIHFLCALHGRHPGIVDHAATRTVEPAARAWLADAAEAMADERVYLARLAVAAGPMPSTPGAAGSETAILAQRAALATLAQSDRRGCALGAALAFAADWASIRPSSTPPRKRLGVDPAPAALGDADLFARGRRRLAPTSERALLFGAQQLALQHRALWDLLEARQQAADIDGPQPSSRPDRDPLVAPCHGPLRR